MDKGMDQDTNSITKDSNITENANVTEIVNVDEDEDIIEGSYILNTGIQAIKKIWICTDYIHIYDCLEEQYNNTAKVNFEPGAVITGQPGIGKSF
ncbi:hypothetical protein PILCRDRAFT_3469 [Piloderma croceum F 1598]|uniref:Uncharacterized protein n=1 Tax=Piloderma croceum (strain F 1598) TaxID=765440 RepID=A0A0C3FVJ8_PILCF|nr:hypothetical protein PILCRDRAFT_3469 [Piloderma croceum F 1598]